MANLRQTFNANTLAAEMTITITHMKSFRFRIWLSTLIIRLAQLVAPFQIEMNENIGRPWLFYCPYCGQEFNGVFMSGRSPFTIGCSHCLRQSFAECDFVKAWIVKEPITCDYECGYTEPFGFVPEADCPIHDPED